MNHKYRKYMYKILIAFAVSGAVTGIIMSFIYFLFRFGYKSLSINAFLYSIVESIQFFSDTYLNTVTVISFILFILIMLVILHKHILYLVKIEEGLEKMASGQLKEKIEIVEDSDLARIAEKTNQLSDKLEQTIKEERLAEEAKTELITNVSHDLRTPLTSILGYLELIERDQYKDEVTLRYYTDIAFRKTKQVHAMVNDLFEYIRTKNPSLVLDKKVIDLKELIKQSTEQLTIQFNKEEMTCRIELPEQESKINIDPEKISRVFENILGNALKYGKEGKYVDINFQQSLDEVKIEIKNYGDPISKMDIPYLFDRFYRIEKSRSKDTGGSGLGLAIAKNIVELHNGKIKVTSDQTGTAFTIQLPKSIVPVQ
ncbi:sensor histidine kinase [Alkalihalobacillus trypoxylicola]|uniref:histidine kinase n=1 Tax=Alkalihalobacillus trypoxylicola TaxID=519424 RepID=A0A161PJQ1_9BACI|nr:HAMP domain-containing sensor histidine kinase [Alkalihalobacillus trypoxylicola]KYG29541.1 hypothetical protein AZF04_08455 [Alkalihalobacillus trypoxylicola]